MSDPRRLPIGAITVRADGTAWMKQAHGRDFKWLGYARELSAPPPEIHPAHITADLEGDTDVKPIYTWHDENGVEQRTYSPSWHWSKAQFHNEQARRYARKIERAYHLAEVSLEASGYTSAVDAAVCAHILTGHRLSDLLELRASNASAGAIVKSFSAVPHPHRVSFVLKHPHGHVYPTYTVCDALSNYVSQPREPHEFLFPVSPDEVYERMDELGLENVSPSDIRHIAARRIAADLLSKLPRPDLSKPDGLDKLKYNLSLASAEVAKRFGHDPSYGSFVHPSLAMAYAELCNGRAIWPNVFKSEGTCYQTTPEPFLNEASNSTSQTQESSSASTNTTTLLQTPTSTQLQEVSTNTPPQDDPDTSKSTHVDKSIGPVDYARFERMMASVKPERNWKISRAIFKLSALAKKARQGDINAINAIDDLLQLIQSDPDYAFEADILKTGETPGPEGVSIGTVSRHSDGSLWEKREDGWHEVGEGKRDLHRKHKLGAAGPAAVPGGPTMSGAVSAAYIQARAVMAKLKAMYESTSDSTERAIIAKQIAVVRNRISSLERAFYAGTIDRKNITKPREVAMSEQLGSIFTELRDAARNCSSIGELCEYLCTSGSHAQLAEFKALVDEYGRRSEDIIKGWLSW